MSSRILELTENDDEEENQFKEFFKFLYEYFEIGQKWEEIQKFGIEHPIVSVFLVVTMAMCTIPVVLFSLFVVGSVAVSITGFLFFEGTAIAIGTFILLWVLFFATLFAIGFSVFLISGYYIVQTSGNFIQTVKQRLPPIPFFNGGSESNSETKKDW